MASFSVIRCVVLCGVVPLIAGCAVSRAATVAPNDAAATLRWDADVTPHPKLDRFERLVESPIQLVRRDHEPLETDVSVNTKEIISRYLAEHGAEELQVAFNEYSPAKRWRRLQNNREVHATWRYTVGVALLVQAAVIPGRVFDRNSYDPYTNTIYVNADRPFEILTLMEMASQSQRSSSRELSAVGMTLPVVETVPRVVAGRRVLLFAQEHDEWDLECAGHKDLWTRSTGVGSLAATPFVPFPVKPVVMIGSRWLGAGIAKRQIERRQEQREHEEQSVAETRGKDVR